jgi:hypothetical protein
MIVRIWRTRIDDRRATDYQSFARSKSLPMFRTQAGFAGLLFAGRGAERAVISFWHDLPSVEGLEVSDTYRATVAEIAATGLLEGESTVEVLEIDGGLSSRGVPKLGSHRGITPICRGNPVLTP